MSHPVTDVSYKFASNRHHHDDICISFTWLVVLWVLVTVQVLHEEHVFQTGRAGGEVLEKVHLCNQSKNKKLPLL